MKVINGQSRGWRDSFQTDLEEGTPVAVITAEDEAGFRLSAEDEDELTEAMHDIDSGKYEDGYELLRELKALTR